MALDLENNNSFINIANMFNHKGKTTKLIGETRTQAYLETYQHLTKLQEKNEIPYEEMSLLGKISFNSLLKRSLRTRQKYKNHKKTFEEKLNQTKKVKPIFITGFPRSGTTLLQNMLIKKFQIYEIPFP